MLYMTNYQLGAKYIGEHVMDARTGYGKIIYKDGAEFEGYWKDGQLTDPIETTTSSKLLKRLTIFLYIFRRQKFSQNITISTYRHNHYDNRNDSFDNRDDYRDTGFANLRYDIAKFS